MLKPNTQFETKKEVIQQPNWWELSRKELEKAAAFNTTCKHCHKLPQCNYVNKTCKPRQTVKKAMENLKDEELIQYCRDSQTASEELVKAMFTNIINIMIN